MRRRPTSEACTVCCDTPRIGLPTDTRYTQFDASGRIASQISVGLNGVKTQLEYDYDGVGNVVEQRMAEVATRIQPESGAAEEYLKDNKQYLYEYGRRDSYQVESILGFNPSGYGKTVSSFDQNGFVTQVEQAEAVWEGARTVTNRRILENDIGGRVLRKTENESLTRYLVANDQEIGSTSGIAQNGVDHHVVTGFHDYVSIDSKYSSDVTAYTVQQGDTTRSIARTLWGDETLWYLIADANGIAASEELAAGTVISIPPRSTVQLNSTDSFHAYDSAKAIGDLTPNLPMPQYDKGCGAMGQVLMVVVAVVATIYTAGALSGATSTFLSSANVLGQGVIGTGISAGTGTLGAAGFAMAGAAGSVASQMVGVAIGEQDKFSWKQVALSAVSSVAGGAATRMLGPVTDFGGHAVRGAVGNAIGQGIGVVTGLQPTFSWRGVAASAIGSGVGSQAGQMMNGTAFGDAVNGFGTRITAAFSSGATTAILGGGRMHAGQIAIDAFGNALGNSIVDNLSPGEQQTNPYVETNTSDTVAGSRYRATSADEVRYQQFADVFGESLGNRHSGGTMNGMQFARTDIDTTGSDAGPYSNEYMLPPVEVTASRLDPDALEENVLPYSDPASGFTLDDNTLNMMGRNADEVFKSRVFSRISGAMGAGASLMQMAAGTTAGPLSPIVLMHGADNLQANVRQMLSGEYTPSGTTQLGELAGLSASNAELVNAGLGLLPAAPAAISYGMRHLGPTIAMRMEASLDSWGLRVGVVESGPGVVGANTAVPHGFASADEFAQFGNNMRAGLGRAGYENAEPILQGSAVTGKSYKTGQPFDVGRVSDFDVGLADPTLLARAEELGIGLRSGGTRTGPLTARDLRALGLRDLSNQMGQQAGRDVNFMIYNNPATAVQRAPSVILPGRK